MRDNETIESWERLCAMARERWPVSHQSDQSISFGGGAKTTTLARVSVAAFSDQTLVAIRFPLAHSLGESSALLINAELGIGSLCRRGNRYELRHVIDLKTVTMSRLDRILGFLGKLTDTLRERTMTDVSGDAFEIYTD